MRKFVVLLLVSLLTGCFTTITTDQLEIQSRCKDKGGVAYIHANSLLANHLRCIDGTVIHMEGVNRGQ